MTERRRSAAGAVIEAYLSVVDAGGGNPPPRTIGTVWPSRELQGATLVHTNRFGKYGCEDFVDAAFGRTTANGIPHDGAIAFYRELAAKGQGHNTLPAPPGALEFSQGPGGGHVDIALGNGSYESGGVQGFAPVPPRRRRHPVDRWSTGCRR